MIGETAPNSTVVCIRQFFPSNLPPRLVDRRPMPGGGKVSAVASRPDPSGQTRAVEHEYLIPKYNPVLSRRPAEIDTEADDI